MASTKEYRDFVLDELTILDNITYKPMFWVDDVDNPELLKEIVINTYNDLIKKK